MGLFDLFRQPYKPKNTDPGAFTFKGSTVGPQAKTWNINAPNQVQTGYNPQATQYGGAEGSAIARLNQIIAQGGYSPEQQTQLAQPGINTILEEAERQRTAAKGDAYSRGLGQSGVLSRSYGDIDRSTQGSIGQLMGDIQAQGAQMVPGAVQQVQQGQSMAQEQAFREADLRQQHEQLAAQVGLGAADLEMALSQLNASIDMGNADRELETQRLQSQYNLSRSQAQAVYEQALMERDQAGRDRTSNFFANLLGGGVDLLTARGGLGGGTTGGTIAPSRATTTTGLDAFYGY